LSSFPSGVAQLGVLLCDGQRRGHLRGCWLERSEGTVTGGAISLVGTGQMAQNLDFMDKTRTAARAAGLAESTRISRFGSFFFFATS